MSQKPGQAPHIFTPNTDPTAAENNPVGGAEAVSAAGQTAVEVSTPPTPETQESRELVGSGELPRPTGEQSRARFFELRDRRENHGFGNFMIVGKHAGDLAALSRTLISRQSQPQYPLEDPLERARLTGQISRVLTQGKADPAEVFNDFIDGGVQRTVLLNLGDILKGFSEANVSMVDLSEPLTRLASEAITDGETEPILSNIGAFLEAGAAIDFANLTSGPFWVDSAVPLLQNLQSLSEQGADIENLKQRIGDSLNEALQKGYNLALFSTPRSLEIIEAKLGIEVDRQKLGQNIVKTLAASGALTDSRLRHLKNIGVNVEALDIPTTSAG